MASVDVVVPCYNYAHYLEGCLASVLSQRDVDVRVLIINDASPDNTHEVGQKLAASDARVTYSLNEKNLGLIGTANRGIIDWASADYTLLLSADDLLVPGALSRAATVMDAHENVNMVYGLALFMSEKGPPPDLPADAREPEYKLLSGPDFIRYNFTHTNPVPSPAAILRTSKQKEIGGYLPQFSHTSDMEMWMRFAARGPIGVIRNIQAFYRLHDTSMSAAKFFRAISDRQERLDTCAFVVENWCRNIPQAHEWLTALRKSMAAEAYWLANQPGYAADERKACAEFALRTDPAKGMSLPRLKYEIKRRLFPATDAVTAGAKSLTPPSPVFGWWPETQ